MGVQASFAYHIPINNNTTFSLGIEAKGQQYSLDKAKLQDALGNDPVMGTAENRFKGDAGFGIAVTNKKFQLGISASQLIQSKLDFYTGNLSRTEEGRLYRHYYFHGNYNWDVDGNTKIIPNLLMIYVPSAPLEVQGGVRVEHRELFWYGVGVRAHQSWMLSAGLKIHKKFSIGYCFDIFQTPLSVYERGSNGHEVMLKYDFIK
jgi:type IX secretion system PorP/SprF family membrane protein